MVWGISDKRDARNCCELFHHQLESWGIQMARRYGYRLEMLTGAGAPPLEFANVGWCTSAIVMVKSRPGLLWSPTSPCHRRNSNCDVESDDRVGLDDWEAWDRSRGGEVARPHFSVDVFEYEIQG